MQRLLRIAAAVAIAVGIAGCSSSRQAAPPATTESTTTTSAPTTTTTVTTPVVPCSADKHQYTPAELEALRPAVDRMIPERDLVSSSTGVTSIEIGLQPGREALAAKLEQRFHNAVTLTVGNAPYRCGTGTGTAPACDPLTGTDTLPAGLHLTLKLGATTLAATDTINAKLVVRNDGPTPLGMDPGSPIVAMIVKPGTRTVVASYGGPIGGTGLALNLHDGQQGSIATLVSAWRCDGQPGSTIPPGTYGVRAGISSNEGPAQFLAPEVPITITR